MTERERLVELLKLPSNCMPHAKCESCGLNGGCSVQRQADKLLASGVIVLPCKIGDTVYYPAFEDNEVLLYKVISIKRNSKGLYIVCENQLSKSQMTHRATQIGKTVFLTKEAAEQALAEKGGAEE